MVVWSRTDWLLWDKAHNSMLTTLSARPDRDDRDAGGQDQGKHDCVFDGGGSIIVGQKTGNQYENETWI